MIPRTCCVCGREFEGGGKSFELTAAEKAVLPDPPDEVHYCGPCLKVMEDPVAGAELLKGMHEMKLRELGVEQADQRAEAFRAKLVKTAKKLH